jgi:hypothetical protein
MRSSRAWTADRNRSRVTTTLLAVYSLRMTEGISDPTDPTAAAIGYVCGHLADLRAQLEYVGAVGALEDLLAAVRAGTKDVSAELDRLHDAVLAAGDALGVYQGGSRTAGLKPAGIAAGAPAEAMFLCPHRRCTRFRWPEEGSPPVCGIDGTPMVRERLR